MSIGISARTAIVNDATLAGLVAARVYPLVFPSQVTFPCITYRIISGTRSPVISEQVFSTRIQFDIWSYVYADTAAIKDALLDLFDLADMTIGGQLIISTRADLVFDIYSEPLKLHRAVVDITFRHEGT